MAGWLPEVDTAPFVKRGFAFNQEPYATGKHAGKQGGLGFKMLKTDADRAKALAKPAMPSDSPAAPPPTAVTAQGKRKRSVADEDGAAAAASSPNPNPNPKTLTPTPNLTLTPTPTLILTLPTNR